MKLYVVILIAIVVVIIIAIAAFIGYSIIKKKIRKARSRVGRLEKDKLDRDHEKLQLHREKKELNDTLKQFIEKNAADAKAGSNQH
jgi:Flp pilus assembly protein TadB